MIKHSLIAAALMIGATSVFATGFDDIDKVVAMKDGSTLYVFKDGRMGMESRLGRPTYMSSGQVMEAADGRKIVMNGNETARLEQFLVDATWLPRG